MACGFCYCNKTHEWENDLNHATLSRKEEEKKKAPRRAHSVENSEKYYFSPLVHFRTDLSWNLLQCLWSALFNLVFHY